MTALIRARMRRLWIWWHAVNQRVKIQVTFASLMAFLLLVFVGPFEHGPLFGGKRVDVSKMRIDIFITSFYYYPISASLGDDAVAIIFTAPNEAIYLDTLRIEAKNDTHSVQRSLEIKAITMPDRCNWTNRQLLGQTLPNMKSFSILLPDQKIKIPFKLPVYRKYDTVTCVSPIFASEQWQEFVFATHIYRRFGTHMHLYVRSAIGSLMSLMKAYSKRGYLSIQPWPRVKLGTIDEQLFNPNRHAGNRNQNGAQNDCLLRFKESAQFISFVDLDDVLIPRVRRYYLDEYLHFFKQQNNTAAYLWYTKRNVQLRAQRDPLDYSLTQMASSIRTMKELEFGKSIVDPNRVNSTWIHHPIGVTGYTVGPKDNTISHLRYKDQDHEKPNNSTIIEPAYDRNDITADPLLTTQDISWIQEDFMLMRSHSDVAALWEALPKVFIYFEIINECYYTKFYSAFFKKRGRMEFCTGPEMCTFPKLPNVVCSNADADYTSSQNSSLINIHYMTNERFVVSDECIR